MYQIPHEYWKKVAKHFILLYMKLEEMFCSENTVEDGFLER